MWNGDVVDDDRRDAALLFCGCGVSVCCWCCCWWLWWLLLCGGGGVGVLWLTQCWIGSITVVFAAPIFGCGEKNDLVWLMR